MIFCRARLIFVKYFPEEDKANIRGSFGKIPTFIFPWRSYEKYPKDYNPYHYDNKNVLGNFKLFLMIL